MPFTRHRLPSRAPSIFVTGGILALVGATMCTIAQAPPEYHVELLPTPRGRVHVQPTSFNERGQVAALWASNSLLAFEGYVYAKGTPIAVPKFGGDGADHLLGLNNRNVGVGTEIGGVQSGEFPLAWTPYQVHPLALEFGFSDGVANAINDQFIAVGYLHPRNTAEAVPVRWVNGQPELLGDLGGDGSGLAREINRAGAIVGESNTHSGDNHAFLWQDGAMFDIAASLEGESRASAINDRGEVVGQAFVPTLSGFRWDDTNGLQLLPGLPGAGVSTVFDINNVGAVVGYSTGHFSGTHGSLCWLDGSTYDLNDLHDGSLPSDMTIVSATHINHRGWILAVGERLNATADVLLVLKPTCEVDLIPDNALDGKDLNAFRYLFLQGDPIADWNHDNEINELDIEAFRDDFQNGC